MADKPFIPSRALAAAIREIDSYDHWINHDSEHMPHLAAHAREQAMMQAAIAQAAALERIASALESIASVHGMPQMVPLGDDVFKHLRKETNP